jgi:hypothetical protein
MSRLEARDDGSMLILMIGLVVLCLLLVAVVTDASTLFLARMHLISAVDGAALAGAQAVDQRALYTGPATGQLPLDPTGVRTAVDRYLVLDGDADVDVLSVSTDGAVVRVAFQRQVRLPFLDLVTLGATDSVTVTADAAAESPFIDQ